MAFLAKGTGVSFGYLLGILYENGCRLQEKACFLRRVSYTAWSDAPVVQWIGHSPAKTVIPVRLRVGAICDLEAWLSGRKRMFGVHVYGQPYLGFESLSFREEEI